MDDYFAALQQVVDDPLFIANRELFLAEANTLANSFNDFDAKLRNQVDLINTEVRSMTDTVNAITENIASLNVQINSMVTAGQNANELMDRRDLLVKDLSSYLSTDVISQDGGVTYNVMMGDGQPLVVGSSSARLQVRNSESDPSRLDIYMTNGSGIEAKVTNQLGEGAIGGMVRYRDEVLQPTINEVGRMAIVFSDTMNVQHQKGMDLNGDLGLNLFREIDQGVVTADARNKNLNVTTRVLIEDSTQLTASDYRVDFTGVDKVRITRVSDGRTFEYAGTELTDTINNGVFNLQLDGINIQIGEEATAGDSYLVQPTRTGAQLMNVDITNPRMLALASPLRIEPATTNSGNAEIVSVEIIDPDALGVDHQAGTPGREIVFNAPGGATYTIYNTEGGTRTELATGTYVAGEPISLNGFQITFDNQPNPGDRFTVAPNTDGYSDNANALAMSDLQNEPLVDGFSYQDTYGQMLAKVGTQASTAEIALNSSQSILQASENALQSVAGVNLDEEAANLVKFQQAYTASAQLITAYQTIFDSLIMAVRR
jgi:flagellar hook-associated protein 1 FlgK